MKLQQQILAGVLFLASCASVAFAAPATFDAADQPVAAATDSRPTDVFGVSVIAQKGDCAKVQAASADPSGFSDPESTCGACSPAICVGRLVDAFCGIDGGRIMNCQNYLGMLCPAQDGVRCRCSADPLP